MKIVLGLIIICLIILVHEFGHFLVAKMNGIKVYEFSIGFGPKLVSFKKGETLFSIRLIPCGGVCIFDNLDEIDSDEKIEESDFRKSPVWARIATEFAGPAFNIILSFILGLFVMKYAYIPNAELHDVDTKGPAYEVGMRKGDTIVKVNHSRVYLYPEVSMSILANEGKSIDIVYERNGEEYETVVTPRMNDEYHRYMLGVTFGGQEKEDKSSGMIIADSYHYVRYMVKMTVLSLKMLFTGQAGMDDISGPVGMVSMVGDEYDQAKQVGVMAVVLSMLNIALLFSANVGILNLLPIPGLDGGKLILCFVEAVRGKPISVKKEGIVQFVGFAFLLLLMIVVLFNDISKLFR